MVALPPFTKTRRLVIAGRAGRLVNGVMVWIGAGDAGATGAGVGLVFAVPDVSDLGACESVTAGTSCAAAAFALPKPSLQPAARTRHAATVDIRKTVELGQR